MARTFTANTSNYFSLASRPIPALSATYTISVWCRPGPAALTDGFAYAEGESAGNEYRCVGTNSSGAALFSSKAGGVTATDAVSSTTVSAGTWCHVCGVSTSAILRTVYLNGGGAGTSTTSNAPNPGNARIGVLDLSSRFGPYKGDVAEVACWSATLDLGEITALSRGLTPLQVRPASLVGYWPLLGRYSPEIDLWRSNAATITGTIPQADHVSVLYPKRRLAGKFVAPVTPPSGGTSIIQGIAAGTARIIGG